jgi:aspartyl-tRNA(Asn)/glutamyl-tRNA(Gln) amidotransferase subunit C
MVDRGVWLMKLSREQVLHIAELAKLALTEEEVELFAEQLSDILDYAERLNALDTEAIPPTAQAIAMRNVTRPDVVQPSLSPDEALANAPQRRGDYFQVKTILD